jgi:hypothetical protein
MPARVKVMSAIHVEIAAAARDRQVVHHRIDHNPRRVLRDHESKAEMMMRIILIVICVLLLCREVKLKLELHLR